MRSQADIEPLRSLVYSGISAVYAAVGTPLAYPSRLICFTNNTNGDVIFSRDSTLVAGEIIVVAGGFKLFDISTNHRAVNQDDYVFEAGTQWYVKQSSAPTSGTVYIETLYIRQ